jgi:hypothetical protein
MSTAGLEESLNGCAANVDETIEFVLVAADGGLRPIRRLLDIR